MTALVIGSSAGGPAALHDLLPRIAADFAGPIVIVSHVARDAGDLLANGLSRVSARPVRMAIERQAVEAGVVHVAPANYHLLIDQGRRFALSVDERVCFSRPSIDVLFASAAMAYRQELVAVVLSGANADGAEGLLTIRQLGGKALVQDPGEAMVATMPLAAMARAGADLCAPIAELALRINSYGKGQS